MLKVLVLTCFCAHLSFGQQTRMDSLISRLHNHPQEDTTRLALLAELAYLYYPYSNPDSGLILADLAITLASQIADTTRLAYAHRGKGINAWALGEYDDALDQYARALRFYESARNDNGRADTYNNIGVVYLALGDYPSALDNYVKAMQIYEQTGSRRLANVLTNIGLVYKNLENPARALEFMFRSLQSFEESGDKRGMANALGNIGNVYDDLDSTTLALEYHLRAFTLNRSLGSTKGMANNLNSIGIIHSYAGDYPEALENLQKSLTLYQQLGDKSAAAVALMELARVHRKAPDGFLIERGINPSMRYTKSLALLEQALQLATDIGAIHRQAFIWDEFANTYEAQRDFPQALSAYKKAVALRDSIAGEKAKSRIEAKAMQYEFEKKEALLKAEHEKQQELAFEKLKQQRIQNNSVMGGVAILLVAAVSSFLLYKKRTEADRRRKEAEFRIQVTETEMKALRAQMNPHFVFNSLNSISDYITKHDIASADYYLTKFARLMRLILEHSEKKEVLLSDDLKALELYMQLEAMRLNNKFVYQIHVDESINKDVILVPPLLLQPFVENSIWHGIAPKKGDGVIDITIERKNGSINCVVKDNGVGRNGRVLMQENDKKQSYGIKITQARIDILNRIKQAKASVEITDLPEGTCVEVKLPLATLD